jgi:ribosome modulation factor
VSDKYAILSKEGVYMKLLKELISVKRLGNDKPDRGEQLARGVRANRMTGRNSHFVGDPYRDEDQEVKDRTERHRQEVMYQGRRTSFGDEDRIPGLDYRAADDMEMSDRDFYDPSTRDEPSDVPFDDDDGLGDDGVPMDDTDDLDTVPMDDDGDLIEPNWDAWNRDDHTKSQQHGDAFGDENEEQPDPYSQGSDAFNAGKGPEANPFGRGTPDRKQWAVGWNDARDQSSEENEEASAIDQGYQAYSSGKGLETNPYSYRSKDYSDWQHAWMDARDDETERARRGDEDEETLMDRYDRGHKQGKQAHARGKDIKANPHHVDTTGYMGWTKGWHTGWKASQSQGSEDEETSDVREQGWKAFFDGADRDDNPHSANTEDNYTWDAGWEEASEQAERDAGQHSRWEQETSNSAYFGRENEEQSERQFKFVWRNGKENSGWGRDVNDALRRLGLSGHVSELKRFEDVTPDENEENEEGYPQIGLGKYGQRGAGMSGEKETDTDQFELDPNSADELDLGDETGDNEGDDQQDDPKLDALTDKASEDPDRQGIVRRVKSAHLIYKRQTEEGTYEELWIYNVGNMRDELDVRKAILAGTDIPTTKTTSPDGSQSYEMWSAGNAEMLQIKGLPN